MNMRATRYFSTKLVFACSVISLLLVACAAPQYDSKADTSISDLQSKLHRAIDGWISGSTKAAYADNIAFYDDVDTSLKGLELRMEATPDASTANLPIYFSNLRTEISNLRATHKEYGALSPYALKATQSQLDSQFAVLLTYELSLKTVGGGGSTQSTATAQNPGASSK
jgi:hypothetical protein